MHLARRLVRGKYRLNKLDRDPWFRLGIEGPFLLVPNENG